MARGRERRVGKTLGLLPFASGRYQTLTVPLLSTLPRVKVAPLHIVGWSRHRCIIIIVFLSRRFLHISAEVANQELGFTAQGSFSQSAEPTAQEYTKR